LVEYANIQDQPLPAPLLGQGIRGQVDRFGLDCIDGWITRAEDPSPPVEIDIRTDGGVIGRITADIWRNDIAEARQGDGRWGFTALPPACLADGEDHVVMLALPGGENLLSAPIRAKFRPGADQGQPPRLRPPAFEPVPPSPTRPGPAPDPAPGQVLVSFIVVFFNMAREAARTLTSLQRSYQRGADTINYEVICIDNGSAVPLDPAWVAGFGPEFRLMRPERSSPSPVALMNAAARTARGHHLALMIDGAHLLSPGVLREVAEAIAEAPSVVIGLRQWFIAGDQRFLARSGWTRAQEDMLFDRIAWPREGYDLFRIASPVWESPNHWFDGMSESNCLFVPASTFHAIGGFDEAFDEAGGGYANLDLCRRAVEATAEPLVALIGEASFHQFHNGTTTNVDDNEKERLVRAYDLKYARLRGRPWTGVPPGSIRLRGQLRSNGALVARQRPLSPARIGVTTDIRPAQMATHFDEMALDYLISLYTEAGLHQRATWRGAALGVAPPDAMAIAAIMHEVRPAAIVAVRLPPGLLGFLRDVARLQGGMTRFIIVGDGGIDGSNDADPLTAATLGEVRRTLAAATETMVLYHAWPDEERLLAALHAYAEFVSLRSYLICTGSAAGQPWLGYARAWTMKALNSFVDQAPFAIDGTRTAHLVTACPLGFLQRIGPLAQVGEHAGPALVGVA
jgi:cephalosporin hydroxylase/GT2 family glycosyltransferase